MFENVVKHCFYNSCLNYCVLIGSFLSSIRVQTDKSLNYASFQVQLSAVRLSTFQPMRFYCLFKVANQKARSILLNKIHFLCLRQGFSVFLHHFFPVFDHLGVLLFEKQMDVSFLWFVLLLIISFAIIFSVYCRTTHLRLMIPQHFGNVMMQFIIIKRTDA